MRATSPSQNFHWDRMVPWYLDVELGRTTSACVRIVRNNDVMGDLEALVAWVGKKQGLVL